MNLNCDTFIKQEFFSAEERLLNSLPDMDLHIPIKNEPISDESLPLVTVKTEPPSEAAFIEETFAIKKENFLQDQNVTPATSDRFMIYELETSAENLQQQTNNGVLSTPRFKISDVGQFRKELMNRNQSEVTNLDQSNLKNLITDHAIPPTEPSSRPILLNTQLRKRHRVVLPVNPIDKRTLYNIEGAPLKKNSVSVCSTSSSETLNEGRLLNTGIKKIINHIIKHKRDQIKKDDYALGIPPTPLPNSDSKDTENTIIAITKKQSLSSPSTNITEITTSMQTEPNFVKTPPPISLAASSVTEKSLRQPKQAVDPVTVSELRVKCLCSLTDDTLTENIQLRPFFNEMLNETRRLNRKQQRIVKMSLLKAISDAEELMEKGKCCDFL